MRMPDTQLTTALPTRTALRQTVGWVRHVITPNGHISVPERPLDTIRDFLAHTVLVLVAAGVFIGGGTSIVITLSFVITRLPAHPVALLVATPVMIGALYTLPLLAVRAVTWVLQRIEYRFKP